LAWSKFCGRSIWIEEWKLFSAENEIRYYEAISNIKPNNNLLREREKEIQSVLHRKFGGKIEVQVRNGFVDLLTDKYLIEIKHYKKWMTAVGQLSAYSIDYPHKKKMMYLFNVPKNYNINNILEVCEKDDICLRIHCEK